MVKKEAVIFLKREIGDLKEYFDSKDVLGSPIASFALCS